MGYRDGRFHEQSDSFAWTSIGTTSTNVAPATDTIVQVSNAESLCIQVSTDNGTNASSDIDINIMSSQDATTNFDNVPFAERNIGATSVKTFLVNVGAPYVRLRLDNNSLTGVASVTAIVFQRS